MSLTYSPAMPVVGDLITLALSDADGLAWTLVTVPTESAILTGPIVDVAGDPCDYFAPDVAGVYNVSARATRTYVVPAAYGADPTRGRRSETTATQSGAIYVGEALSLRLAGLRDHTCRVRVVIHDDIVTGASIEDPSDDIVRVAALTDTVQTALAALLTLHVAAMGDDVVARANLLRTAFDAHRINTGGVYHAPDLDNYNAIKYPAAISLISALALVRELYDKIRYHACTQPPLDVQWHIPDDASSMVATTSPGTLEELTVALVDLSERVYERHRVITGEGVQFVHLCADTTNDLEEPTALTSLCVALLDAIVALDPDIPAGEQDGSVLARHKYGMR